VHLFPVPYAFRPEEAAAYIRLNRNDINDWINAGELPAMKVGIRTIIKRADLEQFVTDRAIYRTGSELEEDAS
jgi:excisionase family DNA binding protein